MRNIIFALIALNLLYFLWPRDEQVEQQPSTRGQADLSMLYTLEEVDERPSYSSIVDGQYDPEAVKPHSTLARVVVPAPAVAEAPPAEPVVVAENTKKPEELPAPREEQSSDEAAPPPKAAEPEPPAPETVRKEEPAQVELTESQEPVAGVSELVAIEESPPESIPKECYTLGPFKDRKILDKAIEKLTAVGATASSRTATERRTRGYWVYLPASRSREAALQKAEQLAARGFTDYFVVAGGERDNAISLGLFTLKNGSERRREQIREMGFKPRIEVRYTEISVYWVDFENEKHIDWQGFMKEHYPGRPIEQIKRSCS